MRWKTFACTQAAVWSLLVCVAVPAHAQTEAVVRGQLVAAADGSPLAEGTIAIVAASTQSATEIQPDSSGRFTFSNLAPGEYLLRGSSPGFTTREIRIVAEPRGPNAV